MEVEQPDRRRRTARSPRPRRRIPDQVEDAVAWLMVCLAIVVAVLAFGTGRAAHDDVMDRARAEAAQRVAARAVLLEPAEVLPAADGAVLPDEVAARWITPGGAEATGEVLVGSRLAAGAEIDVWLDRSGRIVRAPVTAASAVVVGWAR